MDDGLLKSNPRGQQCALAEGDDVPTPPKAIRKAPSWGRSGKDARLLRQFRNLLSRTPESDRQLLLHMGGKWLMRGQFPNPDKSLLCGLDSVVFLLRSECGGRS